MNRANDTGESQNDRRDGKDRIAEGNRRQERKTSDDDELKNHQGNRS
jgi:hypothetical protein